MCLILFVSIWKQSIFIIQPNQISFNIFIKIKIM